MKVSSELQGRIIKQFYKDKENDPKFCELVSYIIRYITSKSPDLEKKLITDNQELIADDLTEKQKAKLEEELIVKLVAELVRNYLIVIGANYEPDQSKSLIDLLQFNPSIKEIEELPLNLKSLEQFFKTLTAKLILKNFEDKIQIKLRKQPLELFYDYYIPSLKFSKENPISHEFLRKMAALYYTSADDSEAKAYLAALYTMILKAKAAQDLEFTAEQIETWEKKANQKDRNLTTEEKKEKEDSISKLESITTKYDKEIEPPLREEMELLKIINKVENFSNGIKVTAPLAAYKKNRVQQLVVELRNDINNHYSKASIDENSKSQFAKTFMQKVTAVSSDKQIKDLQNPAWDHFWADIKNAISTVFGGIRKFVFHSDSAFFEAKSRTQAKLESSNKEFSEVLGLKQ